MAESTQNVTPQIPVKWISSAILLVIIGALVAWYVTRDKLPSQVVITTGEAGGEYHFFGNQLKTRLAQRLGVEVLVEKSHGSKDNSLRIREGQADLGIIQFGSVSMDEFDVIAPLYPEVVHVVVRRESGIEHLSDFVGKKISVGPKTSGMRESAKHVLAHYKIEVDQLKGNEKYFTELLSDESYDGAIITTGIKNNDLRKLLETGKFDLLPIEDARALELRNPYFKFFEIPAGLYDERPAAPSTDVPTLATIALLVTRHDESNLLVDRTLASIYEDDLKLEIPALVARQNAKDWVSVHLHPTAREWIDPRDKLGWFANVMESLAATKELLFALGAGLYLVWLRWRTTNQRRREQILGEQKDHLDEFLVETLALEEEQMTVTDPVVLKELLGRVTRIKLRALKQFTEEELRSDQAFAIFLGQCSSLINKIQLKIVTYTNRES